MSRTIKDVLSDERKALQEQGELPQWFTTQGWQMFKSKLAYKGETYKGAVHRIVKAASKHMPEQDEWYGKFYNLIWNGWLAPSTPVLSNMGTTRGCPVSCFVAGTKVNCEDGIKNIEDLRIGDKVLTHENRYMPVIDTMNRESDNMYSLEFEGETFTVTGDHLVLTEQGWVAVEELNPEIHNLVKIL